MNKSHKRFVFKVYNFKIDFMFLKNLFVFLKDSVFLYKILYSNFIKIKLFKQYSFQILNGLIDKHKKGKKSL